MLMSGKLCANIEIAYLGEHIHQSKANKEKPLRHGRNIMIFKRPKRLLLTCRGDNNEVINLERHRSVEHSGGKYERKAENGEI